MRCIAIASTLVAALAFVTPASAVDVLANWTFENATISGSGQNFGPIAADAGWSQIYGGQARGYHLLPATVWSSPVGNGSMKSFSSNTWSAGDYYQFETSTIGYQGVSVGWHQTRSGTGPATFALRWSINGTDYYDLVPNYTVNAVSWSSGSQAPGSIFPPVPGPPDLDNQPVVYFRLVSLVTPATGGTCRVDNIVISGNPFLPTGACCLPNGHCVVVSEMTCNYLGGVFYPGAPCGMVLPEAYRWEFPVNMPLDPNTDSWNEQHGEESTPIGKIRIDLKITGVIGPMYIRIEHAGKTVALWNSPCQTSSGMDVVFDDDGTTVNCANLNDPNTPIRPSSAGGGSLSDFRGMEFGGPWILRIYRWGTAQILLVRWSIEVQFLDESFVCVAVPKGACCLPDGSCIHTSQVDCNQQSGTAWYYAVPCSYANCQPATGACCVGTTCIPDQTEAECLAQEGQWKGVGSDCFPNPCVRVDYYWDSTTGEMGGNGYNGEWIEYPESLWWNMWWPNVFDLNRQKQITVTFSVDFPTGGYLEAALNWSTSDWQVTARPPLGSEEQYIERYYLGYFTTAGTYTYTFVVPFCPRWVSMDVRGNAYVIQGTIDHICVGAVTGACCVGWDCTIQTQADCATMFGRYLGDGTTCDLLIREAYPNLPIPDNTPAGVSDTMNVGYDVTVSDVDVDVVIDHTWIGDLIITLTHGATTVTLWSQVCGSNDNLDVVFDDEGLAVTCASPTVGRITPSSAGGGALSAFDGQSGRGPWTITVSDNAGLDVGTLIKWSLHFANTNPCAIMDTVVCEPQPPNHPSTYWYDVTPGDFGRCDFHVRVYDPNPANYTNVSLPASTWQFLVHQVGTEWWASWYDPNCDNAIFDPNTFRFQFTNPNAAVWDDWRTTIGMQADPYDVWTIDHSGHHTGEADGYGYRVHVPTFAEAWYWKDCNGDLADGFMPDFDQRQDFTGDGTEDVGYCGPTAVANSIWWFDCKFPEAGVVPDGWTPIDLVQDLAERMDTNGNGQGTWLNNMQAGIDAYLQAQGVNNLLYEHTELAPTFEYIAAEVQKSQDVTLLVGFWHIEQVLPIGDPPHAWMVWWKRVGGHYLTVAGVDLVNNRVALSDPDGDFAEHGYSGVVRPAGTDHNHDGDNDPNSTISFRDPNYDHAVHNNDTFASHDYYTLKASFSPGGKLALVLDGDPLAYGETMWSYHQAENGGELEPDPNTVDESFLQQQGYPIPVVCQYYAEVEAAIVVSPFEECGPLPDGTACTAVQCPDPTQQCLPKKVRHHLPQVVFPPGGTDELLGSSGYMNLMDPNGNVTSYPIRESPNLTRVIRESPVDAGGYRTIATEIIEMELMAGGGGGGGGAIMIRESPTRASTGHVNGTVSPDTDFPADSFFDLFVEIDIPDLGVYGLYNNGPIPLAAYGIMAIPPLGATYNTPSPWSGVELLTPEGYPTGHWIVEVTHILPPQPPEWEVIECECIDPNYCHIELGNGHYCTGGCPPGYDCTQLGMSDPNGAYEDLWCECLPILGACCVGPTCIPDLTEADCTTQGGVWQGPYTDCFPNPCVPIDYYWDLITGELGGNGYNGEWIYYPYSPSGPWYNMWWANEFDLTRQKQITVTFSVDFPTGGDLEVALNWATPDWTLTSRPPLADEEQYIARSYLDHITTAGTYTYTFVVPFCPLWVSIDVRGNGYVIEGTIDHICLAPVTGACCIGPDCSIRTEADCLALGGMWLGPTVDCFPNPCVPIDYWYDTHTLEQGGNGFEGTWYRYPSDWINMWWQNEYDLTRQKRITLRFWVDFLGQPVDILVAFNYSVPTWTQPIPPLPPNDPDIIRVPVDPPITEPGYYEREIIIPFCPAWVSVDIMGYCYAIQGTIEHICLPLVQGACCFRNCDCLVRTEAECTTLGGRYKGDGTTCTLHLCACRGDANCDWLINFADINPFVAALGNPQQACCFDNCDMDGNGLINFADINPFVAALGGSGQCP